jgi:threonylcarbamoyladenosine tRNA methylthiotransferase MtaB
VDYRLKNAALLWKPVGKHENSSFESENKEGYIHGFTENYVKVKPVESELVNTLHEINLTTIDTDGSVRMEFAAVEV